MLNCNVQTYNYYFYHINLDTSNWAITVGKVRLNFSQVSFKVRLVVFWSGIWYGKLIFLKIIFKENFIYLKSVIWIQAYAVELRQHDHPLDGTQLVVSAELGWSRHTCIPKGFMYYGAHFISTIPSLIESYLTLSYVPPQPIVTVLYKITQRRKSMSAVKIPAEFTI